MSWMSPRANALVDAARPAISLDAERAAKMRARMLAATGAAGVAVIAAKAVSSAPSAGASTLSTGIGAKLALIVLGAAVVATGTHMVDRMMMSSARVAAPVRIERAAAPVPRVVLAPSLLAVPMPPIAPVAPVAPVAPAPIASAHRAAHTPAPITAHTPAPPRAVAADDRALLDETPPAFAQGADALARELSQVRGAQTALRAGDGDAALVALDAHDRDFPAGQLAEEAGELRIEALCAVGRAIDASDARDAFVARFPRSAQKARAMRRCGGE